MCRSTTRNTSPPSRCNAGSAAGLATSRASKARWLALPASADDAVTNHRCGLRANAPYARSASPAGGR